jgi:glycosyltransferase involved in cell wall biosynthesis
MLAAPLVEMPAKDPACMKVLVYPHTMEIGGSQLNAVQVAGAIRDHAHEVIVVSPPGPLVARVVAMGLEHIEVPPHRSQPSPAVIHMLGDLVRRRAIDVVHGHEWPPIVEAFLGAGLPGSAAVVGTVMSMSVAPFLPRGIPLTVGTEKIRQAAVAAGHRHVTLLEPPVDTAADHPLAAGSGFRTAHNIRSDEILIAMVCRLVPDLKLEGLLSACDAVGQIDLTSRHVRLMIIGDGPARARLAAHAAEINATIGHQAILLAGEMSEPRPAYDAADIIIGQGGSALRAMAFAKPLVVIGEDGFSELLTPESAPTFLRQGWYGLGPGSRGTGISALRSALQAVIVSAQLRRELGSFGRRLVEQRFSLTRAANTVEEIYQSAIHNRDAARLRLADAARCTAGLARYKVQRKYRRWVGTVSAEDGNDRTRIASILSSENDGRTATAAGIESGATLPSASLRASRQP